MISELKTGDKVICIKPCVMSESRKVTTTYNKIYVVRKCNNEPYIVDDDGDEHYFTDWNKYFSFDREAKLKRILGC